MTQRSIFDQLTAWIDELARKWERHMTGDPQVPIPPERERAALERRLMNLSRSAPRSAADQFRFEQILHRFATYNALWQRQLRERETSMARGTAEPSNAAAARSVPSTEQEYATLHTRYVELLRSAGRNSSVSLEAFRKTLETERSRLAERGAEVEGFEVVEDGGRVRVRARVRRRRRG